MRFIAICVIAILLFSALAVGLARSGDVFLSFIANKIHILISYENHSGLLSCFILRFIELEKPVIRLRDFDFSLSSERVFIEPRFHRLFSDRTIVLNCNMENARFLATDENASQNDDLLGLFQGGASLILKHLTRMQFDHIHAELAIWGETVEFYSFEADAPDVRIYASGRIAESGSLGLNMRIFFAPELARDFPEELGNLLTQEARGWLSYSLSVETGRDKSFLKMESENIKIDFERLEVK